MKYLNRVKDFVFLGGRRLNVAFSDGYSAEIDLSPVVMAARGPLVESLKDPAFFRRAFLDEGTLAWPNGYDISSDVLRYYCERGKVVSDEEMHSYFEEQSASVLKEEPKSK